MPPKKGKKGKKKSKAELEAERLQKEEEERIAREAEKRRLEEERKRKEEEERKLREDQHKFRAEELEWLKEEVGEFEVEISGRNARLAKAEREEAEAEDWAKYVECNPLPDASREKEINTYLSELADTRVDDLTQALEVVKVAGEIASNVVSHTSRMKARGELEDAAYHYKFATRLHEAAVDKVDQATVKVLQYYDRWVRSDRNDSSKQGECILSKQLHKTRYAVWINMSQKGFRIKPLDFSDVDLGTDVPKPITLTRLAVRNLYMPYDWISTSGSVLTENLMGLRSLGGLFMLELLQVPPPLKSIKGAVIRLSTVVQMDRLERLNYPLDGSTTVAAQYFRCQYKVSDEVLLSDDPRVAWWDPQKEGWNEEVVSEVTYTAETRSVRFHTIRVGAFALVQERRLDLPYKGWSLAPVFNLHEYQDPRDWVEECLLTIHTQRFMIVIQIKGTLCRLVQPNVAELEHLREKGREPGALLQGLFEAGINLMPKASDIPDQSEEEGEVSSDEKPTTLKTDGLEQVLCEEISSMAASFDFKASRWNQTLGPDRCCFNVRETSVFTGFAGVGSSETLDYRMCLGEVDSASESCKNAPTVGTLPMSPGVKFSLVKCSDTAKKFDPTQVERGTRTQVYLYNALKGTCTPEAAERVSESSVRFQQVVKQMLYLIRPFSFT